MTPRDMSDELVPRIRDAWGKVAPERPDQTCFVAVSIPRSLIGDDAWKLELAEHLATEPIVLSAKVVGDMGRELRGEHRDRRVPPAGYQPGVVVVCVSQQAAQRNGIAA